MKTTLLCCVACLSLACGSANGQRYDWQAAQHQLEVENLTRDLNDLQFQLRQMQAAQQRAFAPPVQPPQPWRPSRLGSWQPSSDAAREARGPSGAAAGDGLGVVFQYVEPKPAEEVFNTFTAEGRRLWWAAKLKEREATEGQ